MKPCICFSVSLICSISCAELTEGLKRASARSAENNTPSNLQHLETAYLRRISDMAWASICHPTFTSEFWPRRDGMHARLHSEWFTLILCQGRKTQPRSRS